MTTKYKLPLKDGETQTQRREKRYKSEIRIGTICYAGKCDESYKDRDAGKVVCGEIVGGRRL